MSYQAALAAVFVEGWLFVILAVTGVRAAVIRVVPRSIMLVSGQRKTWAGFRARQVQLHATPEQEHPSSSEHLGCAQMLCTHQPAWLQ